MLLGVSSSGLCRYSVARFEGCNFRALCGFEELGCARCEGMISGRVNFSERVRPKSGSAQSSIGKKTIDGSKLIHVGPNRQFPVEMSRIGAMRTLKRGHLLRYKIPSSTSKWITRINTYIYDHPAAGRNHELLSQVPPSSAFISLPSR